jgi:hypothetical protein
MSRVLYGITIGGILGPLTVAPEWYLARYDTPIPLWILNTTSTLGTVGYLAGYAANHNAHVANLWVVGLVNFAVYFGLTYLVFAIWRKWKVRS